MGAEPLAVTLYRQVLAGKTVEELAESTGIPLPRIRQRVLAAEAYLSRTPAVLKRAESAVSGD